MRRHDDQYQNNRYYQMGVREAEQDYGHHKRRDHRHKFHNDEDNQAYQAGYEHAWSSHDSNRDEHRDNDRDEHHNDENRSH